MKVVVCSDVHGHQQRLERIVELHQDADYIISLGDSDVDPDYLLRRDIIHVKGNIAGDPGFAYHTELQVDAVRIFITHGHKFHVHRTLQPLITHGLAQGYQVVLFGHTHKLHKEYVDGCWVMNPGSISSPRNHLPPSYLIIEIHNTTIDCTFKDAITDRTLEV